MTHDELLEKIERERKFLQKYIDGEDFTVLHALRAVVELHKPATANSFTNNDCICMLPYRKCATIEAIEKELL